MLSFLRFYYAHGVGFYGIGMMLILSGILAFGMTGGKVRLVAVTLVPYGAIFVLMVVIGNLATIDVAPNAWFAHLPRPEKMMMRASIEKSHDPISVFRFVQLQSQYQSRLSSDLAKQRRVIRRTKQDAKKMHDPAIVQQLSVLDVPISS